MSSLCLHSRDQYSEYLRFYTLRRDINLFVGQRRTKCVIVYNDIPPQSDHRKGSSHVDVVPKQDDDRNGVYPATIFHDPFHDDVHRIVLFYAT